MEDDVLTRNSSDELALRVTQSSGDTGTNKEDVYTRDSQGRLAVRTVGGSGGGDSLPDQTGNAGKFLTTDGTTASWSDKAIVNTATGTNAVTIGGTATDKSEAVNIGVGSQANASGCIAIGRNTVNDGVGVVIGQRASAGQLGRIAIGYDAKASGAYSIAIGDSVTATAKSSLAIGGKSTAECAIQLGNGDNSDANTFKVSNANGNFEMMDENGNVPLERLTYVTDQIGDISTALTAILGE